MVTEPRRLNALGQFLAGLAELSERTGVGIYGVESLEVDGARFPFQAAHRSDGSFDYHVDLTPAGLPTYAVTTEEAS